MKQIPSKEYIFFLDKTSSQAIDNAADCVYFWITSVKTYNKYKVYAYDCLTAEKLYRTYPGFRGLDDMEGHFEFATNDAARVREYLISLGMRDGGEAD